MSRKSKTHARRPEAEAAHSSLSASQSANNQPESALERAQAARDFHPTGNGKAKGQPGRNRDVILGLLLIVATILAFQPAWNAGFIWDDDLYVTENVLLSAPDGLRRIWFSFDSPSQYFPLTYTVFRMEYALWGLNPAGYHWVNILLHAANALLVWQLLRRLALPGAWLGAALWALHPVQVESVAWITELKNVLMGFFFLLTLLAWIGFVKNQSGRRWKYYALALAFYILALFSKTTACTLPAALLLVLWLQGEPINRSRLVQIIPFIALGIGMGLLAVWWERYQQGTQGQLFEMGLMERILVASRAVWFYAGKLFWPVNLMFSYPRWTVSPSDPLAYVWIVATVGFGAAIYCARRYVGRSVGIAALFFVSTLSPVLGFIMLYTFLYTFVADHYQYVASLGPLALIAAWVAGLTTSLNRRIPWLEVVLCGGLLLVLGTLSWRQARVYQSEETLWTDTLNKNPHSWLAHNNVGFLFFKAGRVDEAIAHYQQALAINPNHLETCINLGVALIKMGRMNEAIAYYQKAVAINPNDADTHNNLGDAFFRTGRMDEAVAHLRKAVELDAQSLTARNNLAWALATGPVASLRNGGQAVALAEQSLQLAGGNNPELLGTLGAAYAEAGRFSDAVTTGQLAMELATAQRNQALSAKLQRELVLYQSGLPCRDNKQTVVPAPKNQ